MKAAQEEAVNKLFKAQETNLKLTADVSKAESLYSNTKSTLADEQKRWKFQQEEYSGEIDTLKVYVVTSLAMTMI